MKRYAAVTSTLLMTVMSGCMYELRDEFTECRLNCRTRWAAHSAWTNTSPACVGMSCPHSFKEGFIAGYTNVANGGTGCVPAMPIYSMHNHMWMDRCSDSEKYSAWYDGFEIGAITAKGEGMADINRITTRLPQATPVDYSSAGRANTSTSPLESSTDSTIPPAPLTEPDALGGPQTSR